MLTGACLRIGDGGLPFAPFVAALRELVRGVPPGELAALLGPGRGRLARLVPELDGPAGSDAHGLESRRRARAQLFEAVLDALERVARQGPLVLIIEDLQWADRSSLDLLTYLARVIRDGPILIVATSGATRSATDSPCSPTWPSSSGWMAWSASSSGRSRDATSARSWSGRSAGRRTMRSSTRSWSGPTATRSSSTSCSTPGAKPRRPTGRAPTTPNRTTRARSTCRPASEMSCSPAWPASRRRRARSCAPRPPPAASSMTIFSPRSWSGRRARSATRSARRSSGGSSSAVVDPDDRDPDAADPPVAHAFRHELIREVVLGELFAGERQRLHAGFATALAARAAADGAAPRAERPDAAELAYHWDAAHDWPRALRATVDAGFAAEHAYAFAEALRHDERALELWDRIDDADLLVLGDRATLLERTAEMASLTGDHRRSVELGRAAVAAIPKGTGRHASRPVPRAAALVPLGGG